MNCTWSPRAAWMKLSSTSYVCLVSCVLGRYMMPTISSMPSDNSVVPFIFIISCLASSLFLRLKNNQENQHCSHGMCWIVYCPFLDNRRFKFGLQLFGIQGNVQNVLEYSLCLTFFHLWGFGFLGFVSHSALSQLFGCERQYLSGGLISGPPINQRSIRL